MCVCVCVCLYKRERDRQTDRERQMDIFDGTITADGIELAGIIMSNVDPKTRENNGRQNMGVEFTRLIR